jgi:dipeptidyl aminopeptidase/acylaminoacyl peptidase
LPSFDAQSVSGVLESLLPDPKTSPYGSWRSPITSDLIVQDSISLLDVLIDGDDVYWLEGRPCEGGRYVLVRRHADGSTTDVNPAPLNARCRVHEYGGGSVCVAESAVYFSNDKDQRLYRQTANSEPRPLTPAPAGSDSQLRYADGRIDKRRGLWIGVREDHSDPAHRGIDAVNTIVAIDVTQGGPGKVLVSGNDFYSSPRLSPDGRRLAWLAWNHPHMPWVSTELWMADVTDDGRLTNRTRLAGSDSESIFQPEWSPVGELFFISDRTNWWNLYHWHDGEARPLRPLAAEFGQPQWVFGMSTYAFADAQTIVCSYIQGGLGKLATLDVATGRLTPLDLPYTDFSAIRAHANRVLFRGGSPTHPPSVVMLDLSTRQHQALRTASPVADQPGIKRYLTQVRPVEFDTSNGQKAYGLFYPPHNPDFRAPEAEKPPLLVKVHGGPTAAASSTLDLRIQYWTSRGIAVLDVNYGGSTGFGREYRERLQGAWGVVDVDDCINGARSLAREGLIDGDRAVITGGSAGGYTTLAALTFRDFFKGGGSHYGVSDLEALDLDTHKFESRYNQWLIGDYPAQKPLYEERSPVHFADRVKCPIIFFQGDEDRIVPPSQTEGMVDALRHSGVPVGYFLFAGEQHGFRKAENIKRALDAELYFYSELVFRIGLSF